MTVQIFAASGLRGAAVLAAALDSGLLGDAGRRILLLCDTSAVPEASVPLRQAPGFERLTARFDEVLSWNDAVHPLHPAAWTPAPTTYPCGNGICGAPGTSGTRRSSWSWSLRTPPPPWPSPRSSPVGR